MRIEIPDWLWGNLVSFNAWRGQWLSWQLWLFGVHIFTFTVPPWNVLVGFGILNALFWLTDAINGFLEWAGDRIDDLTRGLDYVRGIVIPWLSDRVEDLRRGVQYVTDKIAEFAIDVFKLWVEVNAWWTKFWSGIGIWWVGTWTWLNPEIDRRDAAASQSLWDRLAAIREWFDTHGPNLLRFLFNPWAFLWDTVVKPLLDNDILTVSPLQPVLDFYNVVKTEIEALVRDPALWVYLQLEAYVKRNAELVRRAVTTVLELMW